jgi:ABC-type sugar transport system permease subunit
LSKVDVTGQGIVIIFQGLQNYKNIFQIEQGFIFLESLYSFIPEMFVQTVIIIVFSVIIAMLLNQPIKGRGIYRSIFFLPVIIASGPVINELITQGAAGTSIMETYGFIALIKDNLNPKLAEPIIKLFSQIIIIFWFSGVQILIFLAGLQKMDKQVYEAAKVDGAGPWETFWKITLPSLSNLIFVNVIYTIVLLATFAENGVIQSIKANMFNTQTGFGIASAMAWIYFVAIMAAIGLVTIIMYPRKKKAGGY